MDRYQRKPEYVQMEVLPPGGHSTANPALRNRGDTVVRVVTDSGHEYLMDARQFHAEFVPAPEPVAVAEVEPPVVATPTKPKHPRKPEKAHA